MPSASCSAASRQLYQSLPRFSELAEHLQVWPAHGAGSTCGKALGAVPQTTVGYEKRYNAKLAIAGSFIGGRAGQYVPQAKLKKGFAVFLVVMGVFVFWQNASGLF